MSSDGFRAAMRRFPTGVTIVTTLVGAKAYGFTANAFTSVSADPPMVLICVSRDATSHPLISQAGFFCVNILSHDQVEIAKRFADRATREGRFEGLGFRKEGTGAPVLDGALAFVDCRLAEEHTAGTHTVFLGLVVASGAQAGSPLGYFNAGYRDFGVKAGPA